MRYRVTDALNIVLSNISHYEITVKQKRTFKPIYMLSSFTASHYYCKFLLFAYFKLLFKKKKKQIHLTVEQGLDLFDLIIMS